MDAHTLELLEFDKVRDMLAAHAACSLGKELARAIEPLTDVDRIRDEIAMVTEMVHSIGRGESPPFGGLHDIRLTVRRAQVGAMLTAEQLLEIAETLTCTGAIYRFRMRLDAICQRLISLLAPMEDHGLVGKSIGGCIDGRGQVLDSASPELARVRVKLADVDERVQIQIRRLLRDPKLRDALRYPNATVSGDHYVLPVASNFRHLVPGIVHRTSSTGETIFVEPAAVANLSAERAILKNEEDREVKRILRKLTAEIARISKPLLHALEVMARLDLITAKARLSLTYRMAPPDLNLDGRLWLRQARHPLLEQMFRLKAKEEGGQAVVPIDVRLGHEFNLLIITGPNTGGKTVALKTTGLLCVMALCGLHIPAAEGSIVPVLSGVFADIGDEQSLEQSLSTFSSHVSRIAGILKETGPATLVLLDELGAGTEPVEGSALGRAILDALDRSGCRAMVTTHLGDLKTYAFANDCAENAAVEFDVETMRPTFRLLIGQFGVSNALKIARRLKLPREVLKAARRYLRRKQRRTPELLRLQELKAETEEARAAALAAQHEAQREREDYEARISKLDRESADAVKLRDARARLRANDRVRVERFDQPGRLVRIDHLKKLALVSVGLGQWEVPLDEVFPFEAS